MLSLLALLTLGQRLGTATQLGCDPSGPIMCPGYSAAFFEFAPSSGLGMGAACACATPTGAKGEAMTFSRASSATCLKTVGTAPQAIANGDMVTCSSGQPRVMPGTDGTGISGLLVEASRTNILLRSQELNNVAWSTDNVGAPGAPTVTADAATAPDGTVTAERLQIPATSTSQSSGLLQTISNASAAASSAFWYLKGNSTSGALDLGLWSGASYACVVCSYNASTWTPCKLENINGGGASATFVVGNLSVSSRCNSGARGAADVFAWGTQWEVGAYVTSYIATTSAAVTRSADQADLAITLPTLTGLSVANTIVLPVGFASHRL